MGLAGRRPGSEQSLPAPPTWGEGGGRCLAAPRFAPARRRPRPGDPCRGEGPRRAPSPPANSAPSGQWAPSPPPPTGGKIQRQRSAARHGARRPESEGGGGRGDRRGWRRTRQPAGRSPSRPSLCPQPHRRGKGGRADQQPLKSRPRGKRSLHTKRSGTPTLRQHQRRGWPDALWPPTASGACPARAPPGPGFALGAPLPDSPKAPCPSS